MSKRWSCALVALSLLGGSAGASAFTDGEWSGFIAAQGRWFPSSPLGAEQERHSASVAFEPEYYAEWGDRRQSLLFKTFVRLDSADSDRTHADVRELMWQYVGDSFEVRAGIGKVFWGVTEAQHLVDIINQTDLVESLDGEEKLGQPMVNLALIESWGTVNLFVLPGFRERTFPGPSGRLRTTPRVNTDRAAFDSGAGRGHIDVAARYSHYFGDVDVGISHFYGTSREPRLIPKQNVQNQVELVPFYDRIHQTGVDVQLTQDAWLWKVEAIRRTGQGSAYYGATGGFEYTFFGLFDSAVDVGVISEYLYDSRGEGGGSAFQNDVLTGVRFALNDAQDTSMLVGVITDLDNGTQLFTMEASRRLGNTWKLTVEGSLFTGTPAGDPLHTLRNDDFIQVEVAKYF
jgi:hypothetical protein